jgi:hypothetical protein
MNISHRLFTKHTELIKQQSKTVPESEQAIVYLNTISPCRDIIYHEVQNIGDGGIRVTNQGK